MNKRIRAIIKDKTNGNNQQFASLLGWTPQYLSKLLRGESIGINPIIAIVTKFEDIDARWLLTGKGEMHDSFAKNVISVQIEAMKTSIAKQQKELDMMSKIILQKP